MQDMLFNHFARKKRTKRRYGSIAETLARLKDLNSQLDPSEDCEKRTRKVPALGSKKGCMKGKGGPENRNFDYWGVRQQTWGKWVAEICEPDRGERLWLGTFPTSTEAAIAYDEAARAMYGPSAQLNFPQCNTISRDSTPSAQLNSPQCNTVSRNSSLTSESSVCATTSHNGVSVGDSELTAPEVEAVVDDKLRNVSAVEDPKLSLREMEQVDRPQNASAVEDPELSLTEVKRTGGVRNASDVEDPELSLADVEQVDRLRNALAVEDPDLRLTDMEQADRLQNASDVEDPELSLAEVEQVDRLENALAVEDPDLRLADMEQADRLQNALAVEDPELSLTEVEQVDDKWLADEALTWAVKREQDVMSLVANKKHHEHPLEAADILDIDEMLKLIDADPPNGSSVDIGPRISRI